MGIMCASELLEYQRDQDHTIKNSRSTQKDHQDCDVVCRVSCWSSKASM